MMAYDPMNSTKKLQYLIMNFLSILSCCLKFTSQDHVGDVGVNAWAWMDHDALYFCYPTPQTLDCTRVVPRVELSRAGSTIGSSEGQNAFGRCSFSLLQAILNFLLPSLHNT